nr:extracellular serine/threonine protein kinase four-jointed-like [Cherax quadricarinatus]
MIVVNSKMTSSDSPRLNLATASRDFLATVDYPLRPVVSRTWDKPSRSRSRWNCSYFPQSFPVYRMQRVVSVVLCLLGLLLLSVVAFVLVQVTPTTQILRMELTPTPDTKNSRQHLVADDRKWDVGIARTARKLEDHPEYKRSVEEVYSDDEAPDEDDDEDDLILNESYDENYEHQEDDEYNPVFDMKYFDFSIKEGEGDLNAVANRGQNQEDKKKGKKMSEDAESRHNVVEASNSFKTPRVGQKWTNLPRVILVNDYGVVVVEEGVVFSGAVEAILQEPQTSDASVGEVQKQLRMREVRGLQEPTWERCGRPKNQWVELSGDVAACARYRYPDDYLLLGEVLSFYLARLLGVGHVPPVALSEPSTPRWASVASKMTLAGWGDAPVVVLTPWIDDLVRDHMPTILLDIILKNSTLCILEEESPNEEPSEDLQGHKLYGVSRLEDQKLVTQRSEVEVKEGRKKKQEARGSRSLKQASEKDLVRLLQWSDLLVFDYLTGNYDRVAYMQDAAEKESRPQILTGTIHNLVRSETTDALWLLDNESGLMDAYTLLYGAADPAQSSRFHAFHERMLASLCVFRRSTMEAVLGLAQHPQPARLLVGFAKTNEPLFGKLPDPLKNELFVTHFPQRLARVRDWMSKCVDKLKKIPNSTISKL